MKVLEKIKSGKENNKKPKAKLVGKNGNVFNLMACAARVLRQAGRLEESRKMVEEITTKAKNYNDALRIMMKYVDVM